MRKFISVLAVFLIAAVSFASQEISKADDIKDVLSKQFTNFKINSVQESEIKGLYEVEASGNIMYSDCNPPIK